MSLTREELNDLLAIVSAMIANSQAPTAKEGIVLAGSYDPTDATISVLIGDTYAIIGDDGDTPVIATRVPLFTDMIGKLGGPIGGERVTLIPCQSGWKALLDHGQDDSPNVPAGEYWMLHRDPTSRQTNASFKLTNDGPGSGDALGGLRGGCGLVDFTTTSGALSHKLDDVAQQIQTTAGSTYHLLDATKTKITHQAGATVAHVLDGLNNKIQHTAGSVFTLFDGNAQVIAHVVGTGGKLALGDAISAINNTANAALAKTHSDTLLANVDAQSLTNASTLVAALGAHGAFQGTFNLSAFLALLTSGFFGNTTKIAGSASVFLKL